MGIKRTLIKGTFLLTVAGMLSRLIGFYYRIFLTHTIGAEGIGIYQLIFPVYALCFSLTSAGIQTTISRLVAANDYPDGRHTQWRVYKIGLALSSLTALAVSAILYTNAELIAIQFIREIRCAGLLRILAFAIPLGAVHSAACGYYYGIKNAKIPAVTQIVEQITRVGGVYLISLICISRHELFTPAYAVWGLVIGEASSMLVSLTAVKYRQGNMLYDRKKAKKPLFSLIVRQSVPLTANRLCINFLQSAEAVLIPSMLKCHGLSTSAALSTYGILTGMSLPLVLFPSALTNSVSVMLLPTVAEAQSKKQTDSIRRAIETSIKYCLLLGAYCTGIFIYLGMDMGIILFHSEAAGKFIITLAWLCPFLYLTTTLGSIVHGLGKTFLYFLYNCISLVIRIGFVLFMIPRIGIIGYLWGVLASQLLLTALLLHCLNTECPVTWHAVDWIVKPAASILTGIMLCRFAAPVFRTAPWPQAVTLGIRGLIITFGCAAAAIYFGLIQLPAHAAASKLPARQKIDRP